MFLWQAHLCSLCPNQLFRLILLLVPGQVLVTKDPDTWLVTTVYRMDGLVFYQHQGSKECNRGEKERGGPKYDQDQDDLLIARGVYSQH